MNMRWQLRLFCRICTIMHLQGYFCTISGCITERFDETSSFVRVSWRNINALCETLLVREGKIEVDIYQIFIFCCLEMYLVSSAGWTTRPVLTDSDTLTTIMT